MSRLDGDVPMRHAADADLDAAFGDAVRHAYAHAARIDDLTARRHAKAAAAVVQRGEVGSWWRTAHLAHRRRRIGGLTAKAAAVTVAGMVASTGLAAANVLPAPAARAIVRVVGAVGLPVPQSIETAADPKHDVETTPSTDGELALQPLDPTTAAGSPAGATASDPDATSTTVAGATTSSTAGGAGTSATTVTSVDAVTPTSLVPVFDEECPTSTTAVRPVFPSTTVLFPSTTESTTTTTEDTTSTTGGSTTTTVADRGGNDACAQGEEVPSTTTSTTSTTTPPDGTTSSTATTTPEDAPASADG